MTEGTDAPVAARRILAPIHAGPKAAGLHDIPSFAGCGELLAMLSDVDTDDSDDSADHGGGGGERDLLGG